MTEKIYLNDDWGFTAEFDEKLLDESFDIGALTKVRLPHGLVETPFHYFDESIYQMVSGYVKELDIPAEYEGKVLLLTFEGAAHEATVYINGVKCCEHSCGYTAFCVDISEYVDYGAKNRLTVRLDSRENLNIPPFGNVIDYMTYGGIYREVYLTVKEPAYIEDVFVTTKLSGLKKSEEEGIALCTHSAALSQICYKGVKPGMTIRQIFTGDGISKTVATYAFDEQVSKEGKLKLTARTGQARLWDVECPNLYKLRTELYEGDRLMDSVTVNIGFRKAVFKKDGFYLNGRKLKIRGLNRHQSYPYVGYAMPRSMQQLDADILKYELGLNAVRTSHYPQSQYFYDRCDEIGLMVFTEMPGWQYIGDEDWKQQAIANLEEMIIQNRNHCSVIMWGVRINESADDDDFYLRTNAVAHGLDESRPTGGVRAGKKGHLLEDVYTYNDFTHDTRNKGCDAKENVTSDMDKPYMVTEYLGHMFPTKAYDCEEHRVRHALAHANVIDAISRKRDIVGSFGWCMFDYNTHKDFGSGDRICYHGVMDMFRNPKLAAYVYASQQEKEPILMLSSGMDVGEHPACIKGDEYIFTNADSVKMYINDRFIKEYTVKDSKHKGLKHPPLIIDDYIGDRLETEEGLPKRQADDLKILLNAFARYGMGGITKADYAKALKLVVGYHMSMEDAVGLYQKYIGNWGSESTIYRFEAEIDGKTVLTVVKSPMKRPSFP